VLFQFGGRQVELGAVESAKGNIYTSKHVIGVGRWRKKGDSKLALFT
jgi:hypothetical protein